MTPPERTCERCGRGGILLPICGPCQRDIALAEGRVQLPDHVKHGTYYAYKFGCRCVECKVAQRDYVRIYREHGTNFRPRGRPRLSHSGQHS